MPKEKINKTNACRLLDQNDCGRLVQLGFCF